MEQIVTVEETQIKDKKCILLRIKGGKQFVLQCEVGHLHAVLSLVERFSLPLLVLYYLASLLLFPMPLFQTLVSVLL